MGRRIVAIASASDDIKFIGGLESPGHGDIGSDLGEISFVGRLCARVWPADKMDEVVHDLGPEVLVDFSQADASTANVARAANLGLGIVMGTTGHSREQMESLTSSIKTGNVAAVISPNMSAGVNVLLDACEVVAKMLPSYDVEIFEIHHNQKVDSPSGTALKLADRIAGSLGRDPREVIATGRRGKGKRGAQEIGIASARAGDVVGDHTVIFAGAGERIELTHRAQSRDAFASGVLASIRFVSRAKPGIYSISDVLAEASRR